MPCGPLRLRQAGWGARVPSILVPSWPSSVRERQRALLEPQRSGAKSQFSGRSEGGTAPGLFFSPCYPTLLWVRGRPGTLHWRQAAIRMVSGALLLPPLHCQPQACAAQSCQPQRMCCQAQSACRGI